MPFRALIGIIVPLFISSNSWAEEIKLKTTLPEQYVVKEGDTLWSISEKFLHNPWQWAKLWNQNSQIQNPNLIYPGNVIQFKLLDGKPQLSVASTSQLIPEPEEERLLFPHIREESLQEAIPVIPVDAIAPFLSSPRIITEEELANAPYIVDFAGEHLVAGAGDRIYVRAIENPKNLGFTVFRHGQTFVHPVTNEVLGYEAEYIAETMLQHVGDPATLQIVKSVSELRKGDRLLPNEEGQVALNFHPRTPETKIRGRIISVLSGVSQIGQHHVVTIDLGQAQGIKQGHVLEIYQRGRNTRDVYGNTIYDSVKLPDEDAGALMVFRVFEHISYALVMEASAPIHILDFVETP